MIKAARTAKRVWRKRLAHNIFSKPEQHWKPKLEAELYDIKQDKVQDGIIICVSIFILCLYSQMRMTANLNLFYELQVYSVQCKVVVVV